MQLTAGTVQVPETLLKLEPSFAEGTATYPAQLELIDEAACAEAADNQPAEHKPRPRTVPLSTENARMLLGRLTRQGSERHVRDVLERHKTLTRMLSGAPASGKRHTGSQTTLRT